MESHLIKLTGPDLKLAREVLSDALISVEREILSLDIGHGPQEAAGELLRLSDRRGDLVRLIVKIGG